MAVSIYTCGLSACFYLFTFLKDVPSPRHNLSHAVVDNKPVKVCKFWKYLLKLILVNKLLKMNVYN